MLDRTSVWSPVPRLEEKQCQIPKNRRVSTSSSHPRKNGSLKVFNLVEFLKLGRVFETAMWIAIARAHLHRASASMQRQRCDEACYIAVIEKNGVAPKWVATPFLSNSQETPLFSLRAVFQVSFQLLRYINADAWCNRALKLHFILSLIFYCVSKFSSIQLDCYVFFRIYFLLKILIFSLFCS